MCPVFIEWMNHSILRLDGISIFVPPPLSRRVGPPPTQRPKPLLTKTLRVVDGLMGYRRFVVRQLNDARERQHRLPRRLV